MEEEGERIFEMGWCGCGCGCGGGRENGGHGGVGWVGLKRGGGRDVRLDA